MLIDRLKEIQQREGWFDAGMANVMGITRQEYNQVRRRINMPGARFYAGALNAFYDKYPDILPLIASQMTGKPPDYFIMWGKGNQPAYYQTLCKPRRGFLRWLLG